QPSTHSYLPSLPVQCLPAGHWSSSGRQVTHSPVGLSHLGVPPPHSSSLMQPRQMPRSTSHAPESGTQAGCPAEQPGLHTCITHSMPAGHSLSTRHCTHLSVILSHTGVCPPHTGLQVGMEPGL